MISDFLISFFNPNIPRKPILHNLGPETILKFIGRDYETYMKLFDINDHPDCLMQQEEPSPKHHNTCMTQSTCWHKDEEDSRITSEANRAPIQIFKITKVPKEKRRQVESTEETQKSEILATPKMDCCYSEGNNKNIKPRVFGVHEGKIVGFYTQRERRNKIFHFRNKNMRRKFFVPVIKEFEGRSNSARTKPRKGGRFVKSELGHLYTLTEEQKMKRTKTIDFHIDNDDYESAVTFLIEY